jgi:hypothetical protein
MTPQITSALSQRLWMTDGFPDVFLFHAGQSDQTMLHAQGIFAHNLQVVPQEQVIVLVDAPRKRILDGDQAEFAFI